MDKEKDKHENKHDFAITCLSQSYRRRFMRFLTTEVIKLTTFDAKNELEVINKFKSKQYKVDYLIIDITFNIQTILTGLKSEQKIAVLVLHDAEYPQEKKDGLAESYPHIFFQEAVLLTLDKLSELLCHMKLEMSKILKVSNTRERFTFIKQLGEGASGTVNLLMDTEHDNKLIACKIIKTESLGEESKLKVEREIEMINKVKAPSIIEFYEAKTENETKYIYMEYADGDTLEKKLIKAKNKGEQLDPKEILDWIIEIGVAMYAMNIQLMIHRDIKSENILLSNGIAKLADLGISRIIKVNDINKTFCGTPYYASPEMVDQKDYSFNTDIWSLGVVLYELCCQKKPFDEIENKDLMKSILTKKVVDFPKNIDLKLKGLIELMLEKNLLLRPNIEDILMIDFIHDRLVSLIEEKKFKMDFLDKIINGRKTCIYELMELHSHKKEIDIAFALMHNSISQNYKGGFFSSTIHDCYTGVDLISGFEDMKEFNITKPTEVLETLLKLKILIEVSHKGQGFVEESDHFYKFSFNYINESKINNYMIIDTEAPLHYDLLDISNYALLNAIDLFNMMVKEEPEESLIQDSSYLNLLTAISFFQKYKIRSLELVERAALLCNVYQIMLIHFRLNNYFGFFKKAGMLSLIKNNPEITYSFADFTLNNLEIKHAIFRGNKKPPNNYLRLLNDHDSKLGILDLDKEQSLKCLFVAQEFEPIDLDLKVYKIQNFTRKGFLEQLNIFMKDYCNNYIIFDEEYRTVRIPKCLHPYMGDFGDSEESFFTFFVKYHKIEEKSVKDGLTHDQIARKLAKNVIKISFE